MNAKFKKILSCIVLVASFTLFSSFSSIKTTTASNIHKSTPIQNSQVNLLKNFKNTSNGLYNDDNIWCGYTYDNTSYIACGYFYLPTLSAAGPIIYNNCFVTKPIIANWVGLGGHGNNSLAQTGISCSLNSNGTLEYKPWFELLGTNYKGEDPDSKGDSPQYISAENVIPDSSLHAGDKIYASVVVRSKTWHDDYYNYDYRIAFELEDITSGKGPFYKEVEVTANDSLTSSAEWISECNYKGYSNALPTVNTPYGTYNGGNYIHFENCKYQPNVNGDLEQIWNSTPNLNTCYIRQQQLIQGDEYVAELKPDSLGSTGNFNNCYYSWRDDN